MFLFLVTNICQITGENIVKGQQYWQNMLLFSVGLVKSIKAFLSQTAFSKCDKVGLSIKQRRKKAISNTFIISVVANFGELFSVFSFIFSLAFMCAGFHTQELI